MQVLTQEQTITKIQLNSEAQIQIPGYQEDLATRKDELNEWRQKEGTLDVKELFGALIIIYNGNIEIPHECPDLREKTQQRQPMSGQYYPDKKNTYIDISNTWDFLNNRYEPSWVEQFIHHEIRHHLINLQDEEYSNKSGTKGNRNLDNEALEEEDPESLMQLQYLDELHSQFFDALEGFTEGTSYFRTLDSKFYTVENEGPHTQIASTTEKGKDYTKKLFYIIQGMLLINNANDSNRTKTVSQAFGAILSTTRTIKEAALKGEKLWRFLVSDSKIKHQFIDFLTNYKPNAKNNTPEITSGFTLYLKSIS